VIDAIRSAFASSVRDYREAEGSLTLRLSGIRYFMGAFRNGSYVGIGLMSPKLQERKTHFLGTQFYRYNPGDHGIFAVLYQFGFQAILLTIVILYRLFQDLKVIRRRGPPEHQTIAMAIWLYLCFSVLALLQVFWKSHLTLWTGIMFFMVWRMREGLTWGMGVPLRGRCPSRHVGAEAIRKS
jgi:hypothetical protein